MPFLFRCFLLCLCICFSTPVYAAEKRFALVVGNSAYDMAPLENPVNDATDIAETLKKLGFSVILKKDVDLKNFEESVRLFGDRLKNGEVGLFYYAGHGMQVSGKSYLIPINSTIKHATDLKYRAVDLEMILDELATARNGLNIVILDACRDNPLAKVWRGGSRGLAAISSAPSGMLVSYSTSPNMVAFDGSGRNSPYTAALLKYMQEPGILVEQVFKKVRHQLEIETRGQQTPWELSSLKGDFYFVPSAPNGNKISTPEVIKDTGKQNYPKTVQPSKRMRPEPLMGVPVSHKNLADEFTPYSVAAATPIRPSMPAKSEPDTKLHIIGVYEGSYPKSVRHSFKTHPDGNIKVSVHGQGSPITLVLASYEPVEWYIDLDSGVAIKEIILSSYHPSNVVGIGSQVRVSRQALGTAYSSKENHQFIERVKEHTGHRKVESFQGVYAGREFSVHN